MHSIEQRVGGGRALSHGNSDDAAQIENNFLALCWDMLLLRRWRFFRLPYIFLRFVSPTLHNEMRGVRQFSCDHHCLLFCSSLSLSKTLSAEEASSAAHLMRADSRCVCGCCKLRERHNGEHSPADNKQFAVPRAHLVHIFPISSLIICPLSWCGPVRKMLIHAAVCISCVRIYIRTDARENPLRRDEEIKKLRSPQPASFVFVYLVF